MEFVRNFTGLTKNDAHLAGGKGASLGEMTQAGIPVPPGFVVLSDSFEHFIKETDLVQEIDAILHKVNHKEIHTVEAASEQIRDLILHVEMPESIAKEINDSFKKLDTKYVAVRSSATAEDGMDHAWAGQLESYLNTTEDQMLTKVKLCWSSLFTPRAIFYRFEKGLHTTKISVAVVVQKMVESEVSGIAFSVHPVTEDYNQLIIEAGFGLGEAIVSGSVTPDSYVIEKEPRKILDINVSTQERALYRSEHASVEHGNNEWRDIPEPKASSQVLDEKQIHELSEIILKIENHYGFPCDIEWAYEAGKFYIVQSRPITTLSPKVLAPTSDLTDKSVGTLKKLRSMKWEKWLERPFNAFVLSIFEDSVRPESFAKIGIPGVELKAQLFQKSIMYLHHESLKAMDAQVEEYLKTHSMFDITDNLSKYKQNSEKRIRELIKSTASIQEKFKVVFEVLKHCCTFIWLTHGIESFYDRKLKEMVPKYIKTDIDKFIGDASFPKKKNAHVYLEEMIRKGAPAAEVVEKYGWIKIRDGFSNGYTVEDIEKMRTSLPETKSHVDIKIPKELEDLFNQIRELVFFRTARTDVFYELFYKTRPILEEMAEKHSIAFSDMRYYRAKPFITGEAKKYSPHFCFAYLDGEVIFQDDPILPEDTLAEGQEIRGTIAYKGKVKGKVKIVKTVAEIDKVEVGDILVTQMTFPNFIPAMIKAIAFVTDEGGITCHAAIVAREMRKPCIIGTKVATRVLKDGDMVEVDADKGVVKILTLSQVRPKPQDYIRMFAGKSFPYLFSNVFLGYYGVLGAVGVQATDAWLSFFPKGLLEKTHKDGIELYTSKSVYKKYKTEFDDYMKVSEEYFKSSLQTKEVTPEVIKQFFEYISNLFIYYSKTEFFYTDALDQKKMTISVKEFDELKLGGRAYLNKIFFESDGYIKSFLKKLSSQTDVGVSDLLNYSVEDLMGLVKEKVKIDSEEIKRRNIFFDSKNLTLFGAEAKSLVDEFLSAYLEISDTIRGTIANKGKVRGKARVLVPDAIDFDKIALAVKDMVEGEILIAETTSPDIIAACKKAAAIVTNQGGQLSHAAIVSRELGIPCIIGTDKDVILNIKTGDELEVDANNGVIKILK